MKIEDGVLIYYAAKDKIVVIPDGVEKIDDWAFSYANICGYARSVLPERLLALPMRNGCPVEQVILPPSLKKIGKEAFKFEDSLKEVVIAEGLEEVGESAFASCSSLIEITLPESIKSVSRNVFEKCHALTKVVIPHVVNGCIAGKSSENCISEGLFSQCYALKEVSIPGGTKIIGRRAFEQCEGLTEINIPDSVEEIGEQAFDRCINIREIKLPRSIKRIGREAFPRGEKSKLENILVAPENETYCSVDGVLYTKDLKALIHCPVEYSKTIFTVPDSAEEIWPCAFEGCRNIRKVVIPNSVARIGEMAFRYMYNLETVELPDSLKELDKETFAYCIKLNNVTWPTVSFNIGEGCFRQSGFKTLSLPGNVNSVGDYAFAYHLAGMNSSLVVADKVLLPKSAKHLGLSAFYGAKEIEVFDTIDPDAKPAKEYCEPINGDFNSLLGSVGIYVRDGYLASACNATWRDHAISVRSSEDGSVKYRVRMPCGQKRMVYCTFASSWGKNSGFNFEAIDKVFEELTPDARLDYAMDRLRYQKGAADDFLTRLTGYIQKRAKATVTRILERNSVSDLKISAQYGIIKKRTVADCIKLSHELGAKECEQWLVKWSDDN